ncbi:MAG: amino acid adenylation domain-containing protein [Magnetococcus sp. DMHC-1]
MHDNSLASQDTAGPHYAAIIATLRGLMAEAMPVAVGAGDIHIPFLEMGANSLILMEVQRTVEVTYGVTIAIPQFFEELITIDALARYIDARLAERPAAAPVVHSPQAAPTAGAMPLQMQSPALSSPAGAMPLQGLSPTLSSPAGAMPLQGLSPTLSSPAGAMPLQAQSMGMAMPLLPAVPAMSRVAPVALETGGELEQILAQQLHTVSQTLSAVVTQQLQFLQGSTLAEGVAPQAESAVGSLIAAQAATATAAPTPAAPAPVAPASAAPASVATTGQFPQAQASTPPKPRSAALPQQLLSPLEIRARGLTPRQAKHLEALIKRYVAKTRTSKELAQKYRGVLADSRAAVGFRFSTKEMLYPIVGKRAKGAYLWDIDDNEYVDITMGQGVTLFGHHPEFIDQALRDQPADVMQLGPRPPQAGEAARLICQFTGMERVAFTNSGTEAVMAALRLARAATGRNKIVLFNNSYHGHSDAVLGMPVERDGRLFSQPVAPGIPQGAVDDLWFLDYGTEQALDFIKKHIHELAAVLVEPVQSRRPDLQPREFLHAVRQITAQAGVVFIIDEMITGFRVHPGGAQAWFGVQADIATYGKVLGGGMPIGVVAGKARFMDPLDGGMWNYDDASYPAVNRVVFGGTFCQHPLAMTATLATLRHFEAQGPALQQGLNLRTQRLADELNHFFRDQEYPISVVHFGSFFRLSFTSNLELLFYHLMEKGVFIWEWRNYFLSTAHSDADVDRIIRAVKESVEELRAGEVIPERARLDAARLPTAPVAPGGSPAAPAPGGPHATSAPGDTDTFPLGAAQQQILALANIFPQGSMAYTLSAMLRLEGPLQQEHLRQAIIQVVERHAALRTVMEGSRQRVQASAEMAVDLPVTDLAGSGEKAPVPAAHLSDPGSVSGETNAPLVTHGSGPGTNILPVTHGSGPGVEQGNDRLQEWLADYLQTPFDLHRGPLFMPHLVRMHEKLHFLALRGHHIVLDGLSMNLVVQEIARLYTARCRNTSLQLDPPLSYRDYLHWRATTSLASQEAYWLNHLQGELPVLELPSDRPEPMEKSYRGGRITLPIARSLFADIKHFSRGQGCTHFMTLLAIYALWLHRLTGQEDLIIGMPVAGRPQRGGIALVGYCTHLVPIRSRITWETPFTDYLRAMRGVLLQAYQHQDYPFAELMDKLHLRRDGRHAPLIAALFNLDRPGAVAEMADLTVSWQPLPVYYAAFDVIFNLTELDAELLLECDYNADRFDPATMDRFVGCFHTLLQGVVAEPQRSLATQPLLPAAEWQRSVIDWNRTAREYPRTQCLHQLFEACAAANPEAAAVAWEGGSLNYGALNAEANRLAHHLQSLGVGPDQVVGIHAERSPELVIGILAILKAGGAYLPLDPAYPAARLAFMLEDSQASLLLTQERLRNRFTPGSRTRILALDSERERFAGAATDNPTSTCRPDHLAYVIYTSGSTGKPKGTMIHHQGVVNYLTWAMERYQVAEGQGAPLHASLGFDATITSLFTPLLGGRRLWLLPEKESGVEIDLIRTALLGHHDWSLVKVTPAHLELLNALIPEDQLAGLTRYLVLGGEALLWRSVAPWRRAAPDTHIINEYGPTETVVGCCIYEPTAREPLPGSLPIGKPIANTQLYILDKNLQPVPIGVTGELFIGGDGVARGYLNRPELTAERFIPLKNTGLAAHAAHIPEAMVQGRLYRTGDLARWQPDGNMLYLGRIDNQVKLRGFRVELGEIEKVLVQHPAVRECAVGLHRRSDLDQRLVAWLVPNPGQTIPDTATLRRFLGEQLPDHMLPTNFVTLPALPLTSHGKVDRKALPLPEGRQPERGLTSARTKAEQQIAAVWREMLDVEQVGVEDNFFELGGHSLLVLPLRDRLQTLFSRPLSPVDIFKYTTIRTLAAYLTADVAATPSMETGGRKRRDPDGAAQRQKEAFRRLRERRTPVGS